MKEAQKDFRGIQSITVMPEKVYLENLEEIEEIQALFRAPHADRGIRNFKKARLADMTLSLNPRYGMPGSIDKNTILSLADKIQKSNMKDEKVLRDVIKEISAMTGKEVSEEKENKIVNTILKDNVPKNIDKMF